MTPLGIMAYATAVLGGIAAVIGFVAVYLVERIGGFGLVAVVAALGAAMLLLRGGR